MRFEEERVSPQKYFDLYKQSQSRIKDEEVISDSLLGSLVRGLQGKAVGFISEFFIVNGANSNDKNLKKLFIGEMKELFFDDIEWKFESVSSVGCDPYGYHMDFKLKEQRYCLFFPYPRNITVGNVVFANYGMYKLTVEKKGVYNLVVSSYNTEDIKAAIKKESEK